MTDSRVETSAIVEILPVVMFKRVVGFAIEVYAVVMIAFVPTLAVTMLMMLAACHGDICPRRRSI